MTLSIQHTSAALLCSAILGVIFLPLKTILAVFLGLAVLLAFAHRTKKRKSTYDKHTKPRPGEIYDVAQNEKRGKENKKFKKKPNPNKDGNSKTG